MDTSLSQFVPPSVSFLLVTFSIDVLHNHLVSNVCFVY